MHPDHELNRASWDELAAVHGQDAYYDSEALVSGASGLDALRTIVGGARERLVDGGLLVVEHGYDQADAVRALFERAGFTSVTSARDLAGIPRVAAARLVPP